MNKLETKIARLQKKLERQDEVIGRAMERRVTLEEELAALMEELQNATRKR